MPTERSELQKLSEEIVTATPPLRNLDFDDRNAASLLELAALRRSVNLDVYCASKGMRAEETSNRAGSLLTQVTAFVTCSSLRTII